VPFGIGRALRLEVNSRVASGPRVRNYNGLVLFLIPETKGINHLKFKRHPISTSTSNILILTVVDHLIYRWAEGSANPFRTRGTGYVCYPTHIHGE
jgi:hypothetical protein